MKNHPIKLLLVAGARPNFMKIAPLIWAIRKSQRGKSPRNVSYRLVHTGQHYDKNMSELFFKELRIPVPHFNLGVGSGSQVEQTARIMLAFGPVCLREKPDWVIVVGDVNSTMACALVAVKLGFKVAHVEAGLRSNDRTMPEEINRLVTDALSDLLFTPSPDADDNLISEGISPSRIKFVGNVMIDTLVASLPKVRSSVFARGTRWRPRDFAYVTLHRPSNVDEPKSIRAIFKELNALASRLPVIFPVHPRTRKTIDRHLSAMRLSRNLNLLEPVGYYDSLWLAQNAAFVLTDSGGLQEESTYFKTPCLTLRPNTERPITISEGTNKLTSCSSLASDISVILDGPSPTGNIPELWDGRASDRILKILISLHSVTRQRLGRNE
jgi:UDP-N-acetylglucosamine 2-epimerase (non-hydrolysing)